MRTFFKKTLTAFLLLSTVAFFGAGCTKTDIAANTAASERITLKMWGVFDDEENFRDSMQAYKTIHPNVSFEYRKLRSEEYEDALINAFARGEGPDIFAIHNTAVSKYFDLISPMPATVTLPYTEIVGTIKKETITSLKTTRTLTPQLVRNNFIDVVGNDVLRSTDTGESILGLPFSVDTLSLFFNRDLLNTAGIVTPPETWDEFLTDVEKLTVYGPNGSIIQSGAAIGTSKNVDRYFDILSAIMMQSGTKMTDGNTAVFADRNTNPNEEGVSAVTFYTDFANPVKTSYTWNETLPTSFEAFVNGRTAFFFGYSYNLPQIKARAPKMNLGFSRLPQIYVGDPSYSPQNIANYWVQTISRQSTHQDWAWDYLNFATSENQAVSYLDITQRPTALRKLIPNQLENENINVFAGQLLTAKSWYRGKNPAVTESAFATLIDDTRAGLEIDKTLVDTQNKVNQTR